MVSGQIVCEYCLSWHMHALDVLGGSTPAGCQVCEKSWETMRAESPETELAVRVLVVQKDGIYQMLCQSCGGPYVEKRPDLYRGTEFGRNTLKL
jgi:hypothetical protein